MTALTLAMNEAKGVNPEEFVAVRAYHSLGANFRLYFEDRNLMSPTSSVSSGIESYATSESERNSKDSGSDSSSETEHKWQHNCEDQAIIYEGRNILDLGKNLRPFTWQLSSFTLFPAPAFCFFKTPTNASCFNDLVWQESTHEFCGNCSFTAPASQPIRAVRRSRR